MQTVATGDTDFGSEFNGAVIKLAAAHAPIRALVGSYGVDEETFSRFFVLERSPIRSARDLIGKQVAMNTLGAHAELMLRSTSSVTA
ncbi:MAG: ABC transporter substrate-binding protein [Polyangiales bacterium]